MIDAAAILAQFHRGDIPVTWHVIYAEPERRKPSAQLNISTLRWWVKRSFLIMTPEGCVEFAGRKTVMSVSYAALKKIMLKMVTSDESEGRRRTHTMPMRIMLELHYNDGKIELWQLDKSVGFAEEVAQQIIMAHREFHTRGEQRRL